MDFAPVIVCRSENQQYVRRAEAGKTGYEKIRGE